jgi:hypothetical protein
VCLPTWLDLDLTDAGTGRSVLLPGAARGGFLVDPSPLSRTVDRLWRKAK